MAQAMQNDRELMQAKQEQLSQTEKHIPQIMSFRDYIPKCIHGKTMAGIECEKCAKDKQEYETGWGKKSEWEEERELEIKKSRIEEERNRKIHPELYMWFIPLKFRTKSFDNFNGSEEIKKILKEYSDGFIRELIYACGERLTDNGLLQYPGSVLLTGNTGCGKTHLAVSVATELVKRNCYIDCKFITVPELLLEIRSTFKKNPNNNDDAIIETEKDVLAKYSNCELLILDDLGAENTSDFAIQSLYLIIDRRYRNLKPTIVTTNLTLPEIEEKFSARISSRLSETTVIKLNRPDYRKRRE